MSLTIEDLKPKKFTVKIHPDPVNEDEFVSVECKPLRLSHTLVISKVGEVFQNISTVSKEQVKQAEQDMDEVIAELMPELSTVELNMQMVLEVITQMMEQVQPSDNKELADKGVSFETDPKAQKNNEKIG